MPAAENAAVIDEAPGIGTTLILDFKAFFY